MPDSVKAGAWTALFSFITLFGLSLVSRLNDVVNWASDGGATVGFPDPSVLVKAAVAAALSALIGVVNTAVRAAQDKTGLGETPDYTPAG